MSGLGKDRFKRAFGFKPSPALIDNRVNKINAALLAAGISITTLTSAGLDATALSNEKTSVEDARNDALGLLNAKDKYAGLDTVKDNARDLQTRAADLAIEELDDLHGREQAQALAFQASLNKANTITHPMVRNAATTVRDVGLQGRTTAGGLTTRKQTADAMDTVIRDFGTAVAPLDKLNGSLAQLDTGVPPLEVRVGRLSISKTTKVARDLVAKLRTDYDDLANLADVGALGTAVDKLVSEMNRAERTTTAIESAYVAGATTNVEYHEKIAAMVGRASGLIAQGETALQGSLDDLTEALEEADKIADVMDQNSALVLVISTQLVPLRKAVYDAGAKDGGLATTLNGLATVIAKLPDGGQKTTLDEQYRDLLSRAAEARSLDAGEATKAYALLKDEARKLIDTAAKARGEEGFRDAIKARFGITIEEQPGAVFSLAKTYEMLDLVPDSHAVQDSLKGILFSSKESDAGEYSSSTKLIKMEKIKSDETDDYIVDGKTVKVNEFNIMMLHEIGHAVDDKFKIMAGKQGSAGFGLWKSETKDTTLKDILAVALTAMGSPTGALADLTKTAIGEALKGNEPGRPTGASAKQWKALKKYTDIAKTMCLAAKPWFNINPATAKIGNRVYLESYAGTWWSYDVGERAKSEVRNYQWRAPGEWFAEIYAISWLNKKITPSSTPGDLAEYLPS